MKIDNALNVDVYLQSFFSVSNPLKSETKIKLYILLCDVTFHNTFRHVFMSSIIPPTPLGIFTVWLYHSYYLLKITITTYDEYLSSTFVYIHWNFISAAVLQVKFLSWKVNGSLFHAREPSDLVPPFPE